MYYVVEMFYDGPDQDEPQHIDADRILIRTQPAVESISGKPQLEGWCGTANNWGVYALGGYATIPKAHAAIDERIGDVRDCDNESNRYGNPYDKGVVETYRPGKYTPMTKGDTANWINQRMRRDVTADSTNVRLCQLLDKYEEAANRKGYTLHKDVYTLLEARRLEVYVATQPRRGRRWYAHRWLVLSDDAPENFRTQSAARTFAHSLRSHPSYVYARRHGPYRNAFGEVRVADLGAPNETRLKRGLSAYSYTPGDANA